MGPGPGTLTTRLEICVVMPCQFQPRHVYKAGQLQVPPMEGVTFQIPEGVGNELERLSSLFGELMAWEDNKANRKPEDLTTVVVFHLAELYGAFQLMGTVLGSKCQDKVETALSVFKSAMDKVIDNLFNDPDKETLEGLDSLLMSVEVSAYILAVACTLQGSEPQQ